MIDVKRADGPKLARLRRTRRPDAETGGNRCLPRASKGDLNPRLLERVWAHRSRIALSLNSPKPPSRDDLMGASRTRCRCHGWSADRGFRFAAGYRNGDASLPGGF